MKNFLKILATLVVSTELTYGANFLTTANDASHSSPWTFGVRFSVPANGITIQDIQVFDVQPGNTLRLGLWASTAPNGINNNLFHATVASTGAGGALGASGMVSLAAFTSSLFLPEGDYVLGASGFLAANSNSDAAQFPFNTTGSYDNPQDFVSGSLGDFVAINTDPTVFNPVNIGLNHPGTSPQWKSVNFTYVVGAVPETRPILAGVFILSCIFGQYLRRNQLRR